MTVIPKTTPLMAARIAVADLLRSLRMCMRRAASLLACSALFVALFVASMPQKAHALLESRPIATDHRIHTIRYSANDIFIFTGYYGFQSSIVFAPDEEIVTISMGDSLSWMISPSGNRIFLKPLEQDALTNMTVLTNKRTYHFELHAEEAASIREAGLIYEMRFIYPNADLDSVAVFDYLDEVPDIEAEPEKYNFNYSYQGSELIAPIRIFDDGEFTYFQFRDENAEVPAFYNVDSNGNEEVINFRRRENFIIVERVSNRFTLRNGDDIICIYNEKGVIQGLSREQLEQERKAQEAERPGFFKRNLGL